MKTPDFVVEQAHPDLTSVGSWPRPGSHWICCNLTVAGKVVAPEVCFPWLLRTHTGGQKQTFACGNRRRAAECPRNDTFGEHAP